MQRVTGLHGDIDVVTADGPVISIIMPNYNGAKYLEAALQSFLNETYANKELVVVDGMSTDASHEIIKRYVEKNSCIKWVCEKDVGISDAINKGVKVSTGSIIGYLGSDDLLYKDILSVIAYNASLVEFDAIYFDAYLYYVNEKRWVLRKPLASEWNRANVLKFGAIVGLMNIFFKRRLLEAHPYSINNPYAMDVELFCRLSREKLLYVYVERVATINRFDGNITSSKVREQGREIVRVLLNNGASKFYWARKYAMGFVKKKLGLA